MTYDQKTIQQIVEAYEKYNRNATEAERHIYVSRTTIKKYWTLNGLQIKRKNHQLNQTEIKKIQQAYQTCNGVARIASRLLGYETKCIIKYWRQKGLKIRNVGGNTRNLEERLKTKPTKPRTASS